MSFCLVHTGDWEAPLEPQLAAEPSASLPSPRGLLAGADVLAPQLGPGVPDEHTIMRESIPVPILPKLARM